ncbi:MAG TPA: hypothetical protein VNP72_08820, partial [Longimicrobium sp.]|nr:hypothetical protein [Longimicrobium sp.]
MQATGFACVNHPLRWVAIAGAAAAIAACGNGDDAPARGGPTDAVQVVENAEPGWKPGEEWAVADTPALAIGSEQEGYQFSAIAGAVRLADGRIAVGDGSAQVRFFGPRGDLLGAFGSHGAGPEELGEIARLVALPGDSLVVFDAGNHRISVLRPDGGLAGTVAPRMVGPGAELAGVLDDGSFVFGMPLPVPPSDGVARDSVLYLLVSRDGTKADTLGVAPGGQRFQRVTGGRVTRMTVPFGPAPVASARGDQVVTGATDEYALRQYRPAPRAARVIRRGVSPRPFTDAEYNRFLDALPHMRAALQEMPRPRHLPLFSSIAVDRAGNLWVQDRPASGDAHVAWTVFGPDGIMLGPVSLPASF